MSDSPPAACENCAAPLQGRFCHACGQAAHSPVRSFAHAVEEVFESFWHLDGRIFRTLRRLLSPGALAADFLGGHRAPYVAPMRLFVVLCVLTFFVGRLVDFGDGVAPTVELSASIQSALSQAGSIAEVEQVRDAAIANLEKSRDELPAALAPARSGFDRSIEAIRHEADLRIVALGGTATGKSDAPRPDALVVSSGAEAGGWLDRQVSRIERNAPRIQQDPGLFKAAFMGSVPTVLFVLVPVFALLLKLFYLDSSRLYLEHLVVALYSHAFLCAALLGQFALMALDHWISPRLAAFASVASLLATLLWLSMPVYLLVMQKRVYRQGWPLTLVKFTVLGGMYAVLLTFAAAGLVVASLARA